MSGISVMMTLSQMDNFGAALAAVRELKESGVVSDYAIGGAMGVAFWAEAIPTYDLDVFVLFESSGFEVSAEHIVIAGIPVQVLPAHNALTTEAVANAVELPYDEEKTRVISPEYLVAMFLDGSARSPKRLARVAMLLESGRVDRQLLDTILARYDLKLPRYDDGN